MILYRGSVLDPSLEFQVRCFTSNSTLRKCGRGIMGAGVAKAFKEEFPLVEDRLGQMIAKGRYSGSLGELKGKTLGVVDVYAFRTKTDWRLPSTLQLIEESAIGLRNYLEEEDLKGWIGLPAPGCSNGGLTLEVVLPILKKHLPRGQVVILTGGA